MEGKPTTLTTFQETGPPSFQQPYLDQLFKAAQSRFESGGPQYYPGSTVAPFDINTIQAQQGLTGQVVPQAQAYTNLLAQTSSDILGGKYLDPNQDPNLARTIEASARPIQQTLTESVLPNIRSGAVANRSVGGSRQGIAEGIASRGALDATGDAAANILNANRLAGLNQITSVLGQAPQTTATLAVPQSILDAVGTQRRAMDQAKIDEAIDRYNYEQTLPDQMLAQFASLISGNYGSQTTAIGPGPTQPSVFQGILGGASSGASIGSAAGPYGAIIGAVIGGVAGGVSANQGGGNYGYQATGG